MKNTKKIDWRVGIKMTKDKLKPTIEKLLDCFPDTREGDNILILTYLRTKGLLREDLKQSDLVGISKSMFGLVGMGRVRALIQNVEEKFLPSQKVIEDREQLDQDWKTYLRKDK